MDNYKFTVLNYLNTPINVYGNYEEFLFDPNQVGAILNIDDIESVIENFDEDEYVNELLTEQGFYKLCQSNTDFKRWVHAAIKKLRLTGFKNFEPIIKTGHVYILETDAQSAFKIGKTKDTVRKRVKGMQTGVLRDINILFDYKTSNPDLLEKCVHDILERYRCKANREFFNCDVDYAKNIITMCGNFFETLKSSNEHMSEYDLHTILKENNIHFGQKNPSKNLFFKWLDQHIMYSDDSNDYVDLQSICKRYLKQSHVGPKVTTRYKEQVENYLKQKYNRKIFKYKQLKLKVNNTFLRPRGWCNLKFI